ncbi:unnamed protein product [Amoebophrya sp. A25]|nr:unnamed protein product [Amoebophrya sp. A25]|eukprot:GSA25T00006622001.1
MPKTLRKRRNQQVCTRRKKKVLNVNAKQIACHTLRKHVKGKDMPWSHHLEKINSNLACAIGESFPEEVPTEARHKLKLNEVEVPLVEALYKKHGTDFYKMSMDHKVNKYQWTQAKCERLVNGYCVQKTVPQRTMEAEMLSGRGIDFIKAADWKCKQRNIYGH